MEETTTMEAVRIEATALAYSLVRWREGRVTTSPKATNLLNDDIRQHNFGDYLKRTLLAEVRLGF